MTSSSLEVLAGLALSNEEYVDLMIFKDGKPSDFYKSYVKDIQDKITENAAAEFTCIWREHQRLQGSKPRTIISDELSSTLNNLQAELELSDLFEDLPSREGVLRRAIPKTLVDKVGLPTLVQRLPEPYQRALFSSWVSSHYVSHLVLFSRDVLMTLTRHADLQVWRTGLKCGLFPLCTGPCAISLNNSFRFFSGTKGNMDLSLGKSRVWKLYTLSSGKLKS